MSEEEMMSEENNVKKLNCDFYIFRAYFNKLYVHLPSMNKRPRQGVGRRNKLYYTTRGCITYFLFLTKQLDKSVSS